MFNKKRQRHLMRILLPILLALVLTLLALYPRLVSLAHADILITVTTTADELNGGGDCSLREAIQSANTGSSQGGCTLGGSSTPYVIQLTAGQTYTLTRTGIDDINSGGDLDILTGTVVITTAGTGLATISGNQIDRVLHIHPDSQVELNSIRIINGKTPDGSDEVSPGDGGGGIYNQGTLTLNNNTVSDNKTGDGGAFAEGGDGGGIHNQGTLTLNNSVIHDNGTGSVDPEGSGGSGGDGGGIYNQGTLMLNSSLVSSNTTGSDNFGASAGRGGGIYNQGSAMINGSTISSNDTGNGSYDGGRGGGIYNEGILTLNTSTLSSNTTGRGFFTDGGNGGGIYNGGAATINGSTISSNTTGIGATGDDGAGGGIYNRGDLALTNSTVSNNNASGNGGGVFSGGGTATFNNGTITNNTGDNNNNGSGNAGGIFSSNGTVNFKNTIIADNIDMSGEVHDCSGSLTSEDYNLVEDTNGCAIGGTTTHNITGQGPKLGPLTDNGGDTLTHSPLHNSPAIDAGNPITPGSGGDACSATDQRGIARPLDGDANGVATCDIGAFEFEFSQLYLYLPIIFKN